MYISLYLKIKTLHFVRFYNTFDSANFQLEEFKDCEVPSAAIFHTLIPGSLGNQNQERLLEGSKN